MAGSRGRGGFFNYGSITKKVIVEDYKKQGKFIIINFLTQGFSGYNALDNISDKIEVNKELIEKFDVNSRRFELKLDEKTQYLTLDTIIKKIRDNEIRVDWNKRGVVPGAELPEIINCSYNHDKKDGWGIDITVQKLAGPDGANKFAEENLGIGYKVKVFDRYTNANIVVRLKTEEEFSKFYSTMVDYSLKKEHLTISPNIVNPETIPGMKKPVLENIKYNKDKGNIRFTFELGGNIVAKYMQQELIDGLNVKITNPSEGPFGLCYVGIDVSVKDEEALKSIGSFIYSQHADTGQYNMRKVLAGRKMYLRRVCK